MGARPKIVVLGMMTKMPVPGVVWQTIHYLEGLGRLGFDVYYVEAHARTPSMFVRGPDDDGTAGVVRFLNSAMGRIAFQEKWAFHALHADGRCHGMSLGKVRRLYEEAEIIINLHGGTAPLEEHVSTGRLLFLGTDPVQLEVEIFHGNQATIEFLGAHTWHFTFAENYGQADCGLPVTQLFDLQPTRQPVVLDWWRGSEDSKAELFTTVGNWRQDWREIGYRNDRYRWSKHHEFMKFLDLPGRTGQGFELCLAAIDDPDRETLHHHGWRVRDAHGFSFDPDGYRDYIGRSRGEFTVAKDQNVRLRSGWFSDRSATYLAAGRPVVTQDTAFGAVLPVGTGLFPFSSLDEAAAAVERINADYALHRRGAFDIAQDFFSADVVLRSLLERAGISLPGGPVADPDVRGVLRDELVIQPVRRCPTELHPSTQRAVEQAHLPGGASSGAPDPDVEPPRASVVMVTYGQLPFTKLCIESVFANTDKGTYELIVVDNDSKDGTRSYLEALEAGFTHVKVLFNDSNMGFAAANNLGLAEARGDILVLLNNDTIVPPGWLERLSRHLDADDVGAVGPVTNRICNEAQIDAPYDTYGAFLELAGRRSREFHQRSFEIPVLAMFCFAVRRDVHGLVGPIDERFGQGTLEDDDYSVRIQKLGRKVVCAEDVFVHHFGEASFGALVPSGAYQDLLNENRSRFEEKWGVSWQPYGRRQSDAYRDTKRRIQEVASARLPPSATVAVISRGDGELLNLGGREGWHAPRTPTGQWAGWYPEDSSAAITMLEHLRSEGAEYLLIPESSRWWLDFYPGLRRHLESRYATLVEEPGVCTLVALRERPAPVEASVIIPVFNGSGLTARCLRTILANPPACSHEIIVADDASTDDTAAVLAEFGDAIRVVRNESNEGFAGACNRGAANATGEHLVFLNNDTEPQPGWLDALVRYADKRPDVAVVGSQLRFPNDTIQHVGVVFCQDGHPRHLYLGLEATLDAAQRSRPFQAVTAASCLIRRGAFQESGGFDEAYRNGMEDVDLCLRLGEQGHGVHYCHESVVYHLESASRGRSSPEIKEGVRLFQERWGDRVRRDDLDYYVADGLLHLEYGDGYPLRMKPSPLLATLMLEGREGEVEQALMARSRQVLDLLHDVTALSARVADVPPATPAPHRPASDSPRETKHDERPVDDAAFEAGDASEPADLSRKLADLEEEIHRLQQHLADHAGTSGGLPTPYLGWRHLVRRIQGALDDTVPDGATVLVVSRGEDELIHIPRRRGWHFPMGESGEYAGHYPKDSAEAIEHLEDLRAQGADYLVFPATAFWWLEHYADFGRHVQETYSTVTWDPDLCLVLSLSAGQADEIGAEVAVPLAEHREAATGTGGRT